eukprot:5314134-Prymnesium_polylepis.2
MARCSATVAAAATAHSIRRLGNAFVDLRFAIASARYVSSSGLSARAASLTRAAKSGETLALMARTSAARLRYDDWKPSCCSCASS